jgi:3-hydroxyisobutyrate dehydrogenase-like beta-hydroxyacid dehydrogenase
LSRFQANSFGKNIMKLAFLGLGVMGYPMAGHLQKAGHSVCVYNRSKAKADAWVAAHGGSCAATPKEAVANADIVLMCVGNDDDVRSVVYGEQGAIGGMKKGAILVDHTTASAELARELDAACTKAGIQFLDGPVSGGQAGAENGKLTIMVGGAAPTFDAAKDVLAIYAKAVTHMGAAGAGQLTKMVNQICIAGLVQGLSEGLNFAHKAGLDADLVVDVISKGAAQSWQMENRGKTMNADKFDFGFAVDWMRKDLSICLAEARRNGAALPVTAVVDQQYARVQAMGGNRWDTSSLIRVIK